MDTQKKYTDDLKTAQALINRDGRITRQYLYVTCYPLFKSIYNNYETDCTCCQEFIDEIYCLILTPGKQTGHCQLENYKGDSTLTTWLKTTCLFYCYHRYKAKGKLPMMQLPADKEDDDSGRIMDNNHSITMDGETTSSSDLGIVLNSMPNERYRTLIRLRYVEGKTNEETAQALGMTMSNYYNKHKYAKEQFTKALKKEGLI